MHILFIYIYILLLLYDLINIVDCVGNGFWVSMFSLKELTIFFIVPQQCCTLNGDSYIYACELYDINQVTKYTDNIL